MSDIDMIRATYTEMLAQLPAGSAISVKRSVERYLAPVNDLLRSTVDYRQTLGMAVAVGMFTGITELINEFSE